MKKWLNSIHQWINVIHLKIQSFLDLIDTKVDYGFQWIYHHVHPVTLTIHRILTKNPIIRIDHQKLTLFSFIRIALTRKRRDAVYGYIFIGLWLVGFLIFTLYPMFYSLYLSFHEAYYSLQDGVTTTFVGWQNYMNIVRDSRLLPLFTAYLGKILLAVPLIIVFSIIIAVLVNNPIRLKGFWRTIFFLPVVISTGPVIAELNRQGATSLPSFENNDVITFLTASLSPAVADPLIAIITSLLLILWYAGIPILIFLAGLQKIDHSIYEAASIDGASPWDRFWKITLPSIMPLVGVSIVYIVVSLSLFVESGGILDTAKIHMLVGAPDSSFWFGYGYAAAIAWVYFFLMVVVMLIYMRLVTPRKEHR